MENRPLRNFLHDAHLTGLLSQFSGAGSPARYWTYRLSRKTWESKIYFNKLCALSYTYHFSLLILSRSLSSCAPSRRLGASYKSGILSVLCAFAFIVYFFQRRVRRAQRRDRYSFFIYKFRPEFSRSNLPIGIKMWGNPDSQLTLWKFPGRAEI